MRKILNYTVWFFVIVLLIYTRLLNIDWGLPYPFHPDERNMANALEQLKCTSLSFSLKDCFNPHFFAYGQFPLYIGYILIASYKLLFNLPYSPITFNEATLSLRIISVISSFITIYILIKTLKVLLDESRIKTSDLQIQILSLPFVLSPFFIQFAHFGTTESLLMLFYTSIVYLSLLSITHRITNSVYLLCSAIVCGMAIGIKTSSFLFLSVPLLIGFVAPLKEQMKQHGVAEGLSEIFFRLIRFALLSIFIMVITSPHTILSFSDFLSSMRYESAVALGDTKVFYTRQFEHTVPIYFQAMKIFPYTLGMAVWLYFLAGFLLLPFNKIHNLLRLSIILFFLPTAFMYAKWTRFLAPIYPIMLLIAVLFVVNIYALINQLIHTKKPRMKQFVRYGSPTVLYLLIAIFCIPGTAFLSIYSDKDVRFVASKWIYDNIPSSAYILSETANVVDIPIHDPEEVISDPVTNYQYISFYFYDVDENVQLQNELDMYTSQADYIFVPSRRVFANHTCLNDHVQNTLLIDEERCTYLKNKYPRLYAYYTMLFSQTEFERVAEFTSYPHISLFGKPLVEFKDEDAEETWTVFDHPVIRIYKRKR